MLQEKMLAAFFWIRFQLRAFARDESGASAIEYAIIVGLIVGAIVALFATLGDELVDLLQGVIDTIQEQDDST